MKLSFYSVAVIAMCLLAACHSAKTNDAPVQDITLENVRAEESNASPGLTVDTATIVSNDIETENFQSGAPAYTDWDKKIIKTARIALEVKDYNNFNAVIHSKIKSYGAYTAGEQQSETDTRIENNLTIKVPVEQFDNLVNSIGGDNIKVLSKDVSTDDVSSELVDTKARIEAKKQLRDKYSELLKQAKTMKDILQVQQEINNIQEELEAAAGRVNYLSHAAAYSTLTINYFQYLNGNTADKVQPTFITSLKAAFATGGSAITNILLFLISIWPLLLAGIFLYVYFKRSKLKKVNS